MTTYLDLCRVCGYKTPNPPWGEDGKKPSYSICPCCGVEFGYEDSTMASIKTYRRKWKEQGYPWFVPDLMPKNWQANRQYMALRGSPFATSSD